MAGNARTRIYLVEVRKFLLLAVFYFQARYQAHYSFCIFSVLGKALFRQALADNQLIPLRDAESQIHVPLAAPAPR